MQPLITLIDLLFIGLATGISTGLTGASGVVIVVPLLTLFLGFPIHSAIGNSLIVDVVASLAVVYTYYRHGNLELRSGIWVLVGSIAGAQLGALIASYIPEAGLGAGFSVGMIVMGLVIWFRSRKDASQFADKPSQSIGKPDKGQMIKALLMGSGIGLFTGIMGAGGGMMILFSLIFILKFPLHKAIGTSTLIMAITALSGAAGYALHGGIDLRAGIVVGIGAIAGGLFSARLANTFSEKRLAQISGGLFVILGIIMTIILMNGSASIV